MSTNKFKHEILGCYFMINDFRFTEGDPLPITQYEAASAINSRAYQILEKSLPQCDWWSKRDEDEPEIVYSPYEVCEESYELESRDGVGAFSFWIYSYHPIDEVTAGAFKKAVAEAYEEAANQLLGEVKYLGMESQVTEEVTHTKTVNIP